MGRVMLRKLIAKGQTVREKYREAIEAINVQIQQESKGCFIVLARWSGYTISMDDAFFTSKKKAEHYVADVRKQLDTLPANHACNRGMELLVTRSIFGPEISLASPFDDDPEDTTDIDVISEEKTARFIECIKKQ